MHVTCSHSRYSDLQATIPPKPDLSRNAHSFNLESCAAVQMRMQLPNTRLFNTSRGSNHKYKAVKKTASPCQLLRAVLEKPEPVTLKTLTSYHTQF